MPGVKPLGAGYRVAPTSDQMRQMSGYEELLELPGLTEMQKTKLNALIRSDREQAMTWLSPRPRAALQTGEWGVGTGGLEQAPLEEPSCGRPDLFRGGTPSR